jgi:hypothetical protein
MVILFALAGAVAIGASTLLIGRTSTSATTDDFRLHSAVNDSVAQVAGSTGACWGAPPPSPLTTPSPSPIPTPLSLALPSPDSTGQAQCARMDGVAIDAVKRVQAPAPTSGTCRTLNLPFAGPTRVAVLFDVHLDVHLNGTGWAYQAPDDATPPNGCPSTPPANLSNSPCESTFNTNSPAWIQVALTCDIPSNETARLYVRGSATSPRQVFAAPQDPRASPLGSVYLLAVQTPVATNAMEEALLFVGSDKANRLQYEAPLLP